MSYYPKTAILPLCSIYRHGDHDGWSAGSSDITFKGNPLRMIQAKISLNWPSGFRGEDFWKSIQTGDGRQVMAIAHMTLWVSWAKKGCNNSFKNVPIKLPYRSQYGNYEAYTVLRNFFLKWKVFYIQSYAILHMQSSR